MKSTIIFGLALVQPSTIRFVFGRFGEGTANVFRRCSIYWNVAIAISAHDGGDTFGHKVYPEAGDGCCPVLTHFDSEISHGEGVGDGDAGGSGLFELLFLYGGEDPLEFDIHVIMGYNSHI